MAMLHIADERKKEEVFEKQGLFKQPCHGFLFLCGDSLSVFLEFRTSITFFMP